MLLRHNLDERIPNENVPIKSDCVWFGESSLDVNVPVLAYDRLRCNGACIYESKENNKLTIRQGLSLSCACHPHRYSVQVKCPMRDSIARCAKLLDTWSRVFPAPLHACSVTTEPLRTGPTISHSHKESGCNARLTTHSDRE